MPPGRLPGEVFRARPTGRRPRGRPRTHWRDYVSRLAWECLGIPREELDEVAGEREVWASLLRLLPPRPDPGSCMLAVCESCLPILSKLRDSVSGLKADLKKRDKILMDFSSIATTQAKLISHLRTSGAGDRSMTTMDNTTLPWTGSITSRNPAPALAESR
ncbi:hypothetical protein N1851_030244 [Merluccius polli]|uniref:Uncharacterized protein n=1 Tax=Merluccius polli TaxID=89951 RepID=A0AA47M5X2_MERPO|nr:hypothetical protein N1851_030244 [Merluccius polli]